MSNSTDKINGQEIQYISLFVYEEYKIILPERFAVNLGNIGERESGEQPRADQTTDSIPRVLVSREPNIIAQTRLKRVCASSDKATSLVPFL